MSDDSRDWISFPEAFKVVATAYEQRQPSEANRAREWAVNAVISRLANGECKARAIEAWLDRGPLILAIVLISKSPKIPPAINKDNHIVPVFWECLQYSKAFDTQDWENGNFVFSGKEPIFKQPFSGRAHGVQVERGGLPLIGNGNAYSVSRPTLALNTAEKRKRIIHPRLSEAELLRWWKSLKPEEQAMPVNDIWSSSKKAHPNALIARDRIRALTVGRKPGPKPNARKNSA